MPSKQVWINLKDDHDLVEQISTEITLKFLHQTWYAQFDYCLLWIFHSSQCKDVFRPLSNICDGFFLARVDFIIDIWQVLKSTPIVIVVTSTWQCESITIESKNEERFLLVYLLIKVKGLTEKTDFERNFS